jgi:hypothetical protein
MPQRWGPDFRMADLSVRNAATLTVWRLSSSGRWVSGTLGVFNG